MSLPIHKKQWWLVGESTPYDANFELCSTVITTDDTVTYNTNNTLDNNVYYYNQMLHQKPSDPSLIIHTYTRGVDHVEDATKKMVYRTSTDVGVTWSAETDLYDPTGTDEQVQDPGCGYDRGGRFHIFADVHTSLGVTGGTHVLRYMYSDDDCATVSSPVEITLPSNGLATFRIYGKMLDLGNKVLIVPAYFLKDEGDFSESAIYCLKSTDRGATWSWKIVKVKDSSYVNETSFLYIGSGVVISMSRNETFASNTIMSMYKSYDYGETWEYSGILQCDGSLPRPCRLNKFQDDAGRWIAEIVWGTASNVYAKYAVLNDLLIGGSGMFGSTHSIASYSPGPNYGDVLHYNCNMNAIGMWSREVNFPTDNLIVCFDCTTTQYDTVIAALNFSRSSLLQYLSGSFLVYSARGLVTNTDNSYGIVDSSARVTTLKSISPGITGVNFTATAGGITLSGGSMVYDGSKALASNTTSWNFLMKSSLGANDINYTVHIVAKVGNSSNPNAAYGLLGSNGASAGQKGICIFYDDRVSTPATDRIVFQISNPPTSPNFITRMLQNDVVTPNEYHVFSIVVDLSRPTQDDRVRFYVDGVLQVTDVDQYNYAVPTDNSSYALQIGAGGNSVLPLIGEIRDVIIQNATEDDTLRTLVINDLIANLP